MKKAKKNEEERVEEKIKLYELIEELKEVESRIANETIRIVRGKDLLSELSYNREYLIGQIKAARVLIDKKRM